jgi:hypothetical protein
MPIWENPQETRLIGPKIYLTSYFAVPLLVVLDKAHSNVHMISSSVYGHSGSRRKAGHRWGCVHFGHDTAGATGNPSVTNDI